MANKIVTEIELDLDKLRESLKSAEDAGEKSGKAVGKKFGDNAESGASKGLSFLSGSIAKLSALAASVGFGLLFKKGIDEAVEQENAINQLNNALIRTGNINASAHIQEFAESLEALTGVEDAAIMSGQALLVNLAKLSGEGLDRATQAALDLAAVTGISTESAFELMAKSANGNAEILKRYGITVQSAKTSTEEFANTLAALEQFQGAAAAKTNTFSGAMNFLTLGFNKVLQSFGEVIVKSPVLIALIKTLAGDLLNLAKTISAAFSGRDIIGDFIKSLISVGLAVNTYVIKPFEFVFNVLKTGFLTAATAASGLIQVFFLIGQAISNFLIDKINVVVQGLSKIVSVFSDDAAAHISALGDAAVQTNQQVYGSLVDNAKTATDELAAMTANSANKAFDFDVATTSENYLMKLQEVVAITGPATDAAVQQSMATTKEVVRTTWDEIAEGFKQKLREMADFTKGFINQAGMAFQTFAAGISRGFAQVGTNLVNGQNAFKNFGKIMLGVLGDIAIQFGTFFLMVGLARMLLGDPTGAGLVAIGIGLSILGGVLKALSGGETGVGGGAAAAGASGAGGGGGGLDATGGFREEERRQEKQTEITLNVQGNVLDRRETGLELVNVLTEAFGTNGLVVQGNA